MLALKFNRMWFSKQLLAQLQKLHDQQQYGQIFERKINDLPAIKLDRGNLKNRYHSLISLFHSDKHHNDPVKQQQFEQISKIITLAYQHLRKSQLRDGDREESGVEDRICMDLFGKVYRESINDIYKQGNQAKKAEFFRRMKQQGASLEKPNYSYTSASSYNANQTETQGQKFRPADNHFQRYWWAFGIGFLLLLIYHKDQAVIHNPPQIPTRPLPELKQTQNDIRKAEKVEARVNKMIENLLSEQPPCLKYPVQDPHLFKQILQYSIAPDIRLYQVPTSYYGEEMREKICTEGVQKNYVFRVNQIRPNTMLTLSLQAERALQNIYVKVKDLIKQIEQTGTYHPPQVLIRFHGYIMFEIRQKPISLLNYKNTEYVSLFDIFFDYYSPIFLRKDEFRHYLVSKDEPENFGWVYLNYRKIKPIYLQRGQKAVYFISDRHPNTEVINAKIWDDFYRSFEDRWKEGGNKKARVGI